MASNPRNKIGWCQIVRVFFFSSFLFVFVKVVSRLEYVTWGADEIICYVIKEICFYFCFARLAAMSSGVRTYQFQEKFETVRCKMIRI